MAIKFNFFQQLFAMTPLLLRHSYSLARGCLFFLAGISLLVLTACAGGSSGGSSGGGSTSAFKVELTFSPTANGFVIGNQSDFGNFVSLNITATTTSRGGEVEEDPNISIAEFSDDSYPFTVPFEANWTFAIIGTLSDGRQEPIEIDFIWPENEADHRSGGIRSGLDTDGDRRANSVDDDDDNDGIKDTDEGACPAGEANWTSNSSTDNDMDGCRDDSDEDLDDDNDGLNDDNPKEVQSNSDGVSCSLLEDCDGDTISDIDEVAAECVIEADCDSDTIGDEGDACPAGVEDWSPSASNDGDGDGCRDADEDIDDDGDGLIEIATDEELNEVRYALNGNGSRSSENADLNTTGCGGDDGITSCSGYELVADISLAAYKANKGWQPLGRDTDGATGGCQGAAFNGTFEGNGWTISDLKISSSGEDCVGLFGHIAEGSEIRNLTLRAEAVIGKAYVGGLVGWGQSARIISSSVVVGEVRGSEVMGGLVGYGFRSQIRSSSVVADGVNGTGNWVGGLTGLGSAAQIVSSSVVVDRVSGNNFVGGLVGLGSSAPQVHSSSVVVDRVSGNSNVGGLVGGGSAWIFSSSVVAAEVSGSSSVGGLVGDANSARIFSSSVVVGEVRGGISTLIGGLAGSSSSARIFSSSVVAIVVSGSSNTAGLTGRFNSDSRVAYSYVVSGSDTAMLVGRGSGNGVASYWDSDTSGVVGSGNHGAPQTTSALQTPMDYTGIYDDWDDDTDIFGDEMSDEPLAVWCDRDHSGNITADERNDDNRIWNFGSSSQYPAIRCTPIEPIEWRKWWSLDGIPAKPQLNQMLLNQELNK